jgi:hypothetical protein
MGTAFSVTLVAIGASAARAAETAAATGSAASNEQASESVALDTVDAAAGESGSAMGVVVPPPPGVEITGFVDAYSAYAFSSLEGDVPLRAFDAEQDQLTLAVVEVAFERKAVATSRVGFRLDFDFGPTANVVNSFEPDDEDTFRALGQGYLSYLAPVGGGLQIDAGKFVTPLGAEVIEAKDNWNYTRGLLFAWAIPFYHVGLRASLPVGDKVTVAGFLVNGWNNAVENNDRKTFGLGATLRPNGALTLVQNVMVGPELAGDDTSQRLLSDTTLVWNATSRLSLMANYDYGRDENGGGPTATWSGLALYARLQLGEAWALAPRVEWFDDADGFATGTVQTLREVTLTGELKLPGGLLTRLEYRRDSSDVELFADGGRLRDSQDTLTLGVVYAFAASL